MLREKEHLRGNYDNWNEYFNHFQASEENILLPGGMTARLTFSISFLSFLSLYYFNFSFINLQLALSAVLFFPGIKKKLERQRLI